jgi:energy-coupling factor transporter ATP-binding protein EcfA2
MRAVALDFVQSRSGTPSAPPPPVKPVPELEALPDVVWLERIEIRNFKTIGELDRTFAELSLGDEQDGQPWLMVLGENSVGKSSLLQAVALALMPDRERACLGPARSWLSKRAGVNAGHVRLTFTDGSQRELTFAKGENEFVVKGDVPSVPILAYGSTRLLPERGTGKPKGPSLVSVGNLFDHTHPLANVEAYLCDKNKVEESRFNLLATNLKQLLPASGGADITRTTRQMSSELDGKKVSLSELSDGYKSVLALAMDIMFHLTNSSFDMESAKGLVMIDELELHLHPRWKIRIVEQLRILFPRVRFIASTHDPLCVHGLRKGELHVMAKNPVTKGLLIEQIDVPQGARADEVLTGPWFGLPSTMDAETLDLMSEHSALLQWPDRTHEQTRRMEDLEILLRERMGSYGNTRTQRAAMAVAAMLDHGRPTEQSDQLIRFRLNQVLGGAGAETGNGRA